MKGARGAATTLSSEPWDTPPPVIESGPRVRVELPSEPCAVPRAVPEKAPILSFGLAFVGGMLGGALGGGTLVIDQRIASSGAPPWITCLAVMSVTACALAAFAGALWFVKSSLRRSGASASDT